MIADKPRRAWVRAARAIAAITVLIVMFRWFEHSQVYHPTRGIEPVDAVTRALFEDVYFNTSDGVKLNAWFFPAPAGSPRAGLAFLVCHGNGGNISHRLEMCLTLQAGTGANVLVFDYRGYGLSEGRPGEEGTYRDAQAAFGWLRQRGITNVIAFGESLGGGIASELALREPLAAIILHSTFTSIPDIGKEIYPWLPVRLISTIRYDTFSKLPRITVPVLVMHSREDGLARFHHAEKNFAAANEPKLFAELRGDHNDASWEQPEFMAGIAELLRRVEQSP